MTEFETLTAAHIEQYRPPTGSLTHPKSVTVVDPYDVDTPERAAARLAHSTRWDMDTFFAGAAAMFVIATVPNVFLVPVIEFVFGPLVDAPVGSNERTISRLFMLFVLNSLPALALVVHAVRRNRTTPRYDDALVAPLRMLSVPADVATAYAAFREAPTQLRAASAGEDVVAVVEARMGHMEDLLVEAARLHALDADATEDGLAVREQMITHAAKAQSLLVMAQRKAVAIADADAGTALVLGRGADDTAFEDAGAQLAEETEFVREVLNGTHILSHVIPSPASAPILVAETEKETLR
jgi:hypothetical protein